MTAITEEEVIGSIVNDIAAHALVGMDPLRHEQIWDKLYWLLTPRGQSGYASHAIAAIDLALWDLKGQILGQPCWRLLGGARAAGAGVRHLRLRLLRSRRTRGRGGRPGCSAASSA
jgi:L-rhamnonate dehydratase